MADKESLKRLGGGRWETRDGRFSIEPQSGTWVIVDNSQTNELGLPLVRGPYPSLTAAKEAIEGARETGPSESPLAEQLAKAAAPKATPERAGRSKARTAEPDEPPPPPPEPRWLTDLSAGDRRRARDLLGRLEKLGVADPEGVVRDDLVDDDPALARIAIGRRLATLAAELELKPAAVKRLAGMLGGGRDDDLGVRWRLVDGDGREIGRVEPPTGA